MQLIRENRPYEDFLQAKSPVNRDEARVKFVAEHLMGRLTTQYESGEIAGWSDPETALVKITYEYVRDKIANANPETSTKLAWKASDVLNEHGGTCYGKANLLAALLRRNGIPTGFAYQYRREGDNLDCPLVLQALNAVYLESLGGWLRLDASYAPESTVHSPLEKSPADFATVDQDALVQPVRPELGEDNLPIIYAEPDEQLAVLFKQSGSLAELWASRPDRLSSTEHDHGPGQNQVTDPDDGLLDLLYGDPDDEEFCGGGCSSCSGCGHSH